MSKDREPLENFLKNLPHIFDEKYQEKNWIKRERDHHGEFDQFLNSLCDDCEDCLHIYNPLNLNKKQLQAMLKFYSHFEPFYQDYEGLYNDQKSSEWKKILKAAKEILKAFNYTRESG
ncbi:MAG: hypothetical protein K1000chlam2_00244 [Chlamydiae bacterium]|nr:hypothetical protein [Chlamydiota bacterium]